MYALRPQSIDFNQVWADLRNVVINIIDLQPVSKLNWDHKFSDVYNICVAIPEPLSEKLYDSLVNCVEEHVECLYRKIKTVPNEQLLTAYSRMWKIYYEGVLYIHRLFGYLNKQYVKSRRNLDPDIANDYSPYLKDSDIKEVGCMALDIWKNKLIRPIFNKLLDLLLVAIAEDRKGSPPLNKSVIQDVIMSFVQVEQHDFAEEMHDSYSARCDFTREFYQTLFEVPFLKSTEEHYTLQAHQLLSELSCSRYMEEVINIIEAEKQRSCTYVHKTTVDKVIKLCQNVMVSAHKDKLNGVCSELIRNEERKDLTHMYKLLKPIDGGLAILVKEFEDYVKKKGTEAVISVSGENLHYQFVENILQIFDRYNEMKTSVFMDDGDFTGALDKALQAVVNARPDKTVSTQPHIKASERLARYCDHLLRKSTKSAAEYDIENSLARAIVIFRYIEDKDVFQKFYAKMLSNRLISQLSISMDAEESMINKLKSACGYEFTSKLSRMFTDIGLCNELQLDYNTNLKESGESFKSEMVPYVLTAGSWPLNAPTAGGSGTPPVMAETVGFVLPMDLKSAVDRFQNYYINKYNGRRLTWLYNSCTGEVRVNHLDKQYMVSGSLYQIVALLTFNHHNAQKISDISANIGITGDYILRICQTLVGSGLMQCNDKEQSMNSILSINRQYSGRRIRFKLPAVQNAKQAEKEVETVNHTVAQDRKYYVECAVVRIMKTRKVLKHSQLVNEVMDQIKNRFKPDMPLVKKCVEDLIDKMYLQRTDKNDEYQYLA